MEVTSEAAEWGGRGGGGGVGGGEEKDSEEWEDVEDEKDEESGSIEWCGACYASYGRRPQAMVAQGMA